MMNYHRFYGRASRPVETCVVGTGGFGRSFLSQARHIPLVNCRVAVDVDAATAAAGLAAAGFGPASIARCDTAAAAREAWNSGLAIAAGSLDVVVGLPLDMLIEATGRPDAGARHAELALERGLDVALVSKEVDSVVGPGLARLAAARGRIVTPVDGDQPSLLIGLVTWAEVLGFEIVSAGKSSEYDFVFDSATGLLESNGQSRQAPAMAEHWHLGGGDARAVTAARAEAAAGFPLRAVPDLCELQIVANATGLVPDRADFHAPIARIAEVATILSIQAEGGLLSGERRLDVFHCLREAHEPSFAGGVFVVVRARDKASWDMLAAKGHLLSRTGETAMLYLPRHLLGLEAATTILDVAVHRMSGYGDDYSARCDLVAVAAEDLPAGRVLAMGGHHHSIAGVTAELRPARGLSADAPLPFYLAADLTLARPVPAGATLTPADVVALPDTALLRLRRQQDAQGPAGASNGERAGAA
jgi:predicted homoserine dehydrogenase-like protein